MYLTFNSLRRFTDHEQHVTASALGALREQMLRCKSLNEMVSIGLREDNLQYFLHRTKTAPDCCAVKDDMVSLCTTCNSAIAKRAIPLLSADNFVNCLFCQDYPEALKNLNTVEEPFIARAHVVGIFLKLTSGAKRGISYRGSRGHSVAVRQDPSELLKILPSCKVARPYDDYRQLGSRGTAVRGEPCAVEQSTTSAACANADEL